MKHIHEFLRHPTRNVLTELVSQQQSDGQVPKEIKREIDKIRGNCRAYAQAAELPRVPKVTLYALATPNLAVTINVMDHRINSSNLKVLFMLDKSDQLLPLALLKDDTEGTAFNAYMYRWIAIFDAALHKIVDRGSNMTNAYLKERLRQMDSQICPISTESPWSLGVNERSYSFLHKAFDNFLLTPGFDPGDNLENILAATEMAWNFT